MSLGRRAVSVVLLGSALAASAQERPAEDPARAEYIRSHYTKHEMLVPMRDGVRLFTVAYVPNDAGPERRYPVLMLRTPYGVAPYGAARYRATLGSSEAYEKEGFIFVFQDVRGRQRSEGEFVNLRPHVARKRGSADIDESTDTYDTVEWLLGELPHDNGRVGQWGISYPGFYCAAGAIDSHRALVAVSPQAPIADWFLGDDMHRHGAFNLILAFNFFEAFGRPRPRPVEDESRERFEHGTPDGYQYFLDLGPLSNAPSRFREPVAFWDEIVAHPNYDPFWQARNLLPHLRDIRAAVMTVGGWYDAEDLYGPLQIYRSIEERNPQARNTLVMGPWFHGGWTRGDGAELGDAEFGFKTSDTYRTLELAFFVHHLKGGPDPGLPEALVFETGANRWRRFDAWPPRATTARRLYLREESALGFEAPGSNDDAFDEYVSDPAKPVPHTAAISTSWGRNFMAEDQRFASRRPDVLVYQTPPLESDLTLAGPLRAELWVSTTGGDADFVVKLIDVNPGQLPGPRRESGAKEPEEKETDRGHQQTLVRAEPFRGRFRESYETPLPFEPGKITPLAFSINDVFHTFQRGHRVMIHVQSSWFPFIDRNPQKFVPNIFEARAEDFVRATHRVYRDAAHPSALEVRVLPPGPD